MGNVAVGMIYSLLPILLFCSHTSLLVHVISWHRMFLLFLCLTNFLCKARSHGTLAFCTVLGLFLALHPRLRQVGLPPRFSVSVGVSTTIMNTEIEVLNLTKPVTSRMKFKA